MKKLVLTLLIVINTLVLTAQIIVNQSGQVMIGSANDPVEALQIGTNWSFHNFPDFCNNKINNGKLTGGFS